jgi:hypothetical protein
MIYRRRSHNIKITRKIPKVILVKLSHQIKEIFQPAEEGTRTRRTHIMQVMGS